MGHEYTVEFRIYSDDINPDEISAELGLKPSQVILNGSLRKDGKVQQGMWAFDGAPEQTYQHSFESALTFVLDKLWPLKGTISEYKDRGRLLWWCGHFQSSFDGGYTLTPALLARLGEFGANLVVDNYFANSED